MTKKRPNYTTEQKLEALKVVEKNNGNVSASARELGLSMQTLSNWYRKANNGLMEGTAQYDSELVEALKEVKLLKRELKIAKEERDILKKATSRHRSNEVRLY